MKIIDEAIRYPVTTTVGVLFLVLFGTIALFRIPVQLTPDVSRPTITVTTFWPGASPQEVERDIVDEQEEQLKSLKGLLKLESSSSDSSGTITLTFPVGTDLDNALLKVSNRLQQVPRYPDDADKPIISTVDVNENAIAWFLLGKTEEKPSPTTSPRSTTSSTTLSSRSWNGFPALDFRTSSVGGNESFRSSWIQRNWRRGALRSTS